MSFFSTVNFLWLFSATILTWLSHNFFSYGPEFEGGFSYPLFYSVYVMLVFFLRGLNVRLAIAPHTGIFIIGCLILFTGEPLFENDHFRYLWEGKVLFSGENPYAMAPFNSKLSHINFSMFEHIGYPHLSSVYPPLSLLWFGLFSFLPYKIALKLLMIANAALVYILIKKCDLQKKWYLVLTFPLLQKEFVQAVHIDLLAFLMFFFVMIKSKRLNFQTGGVALSFWTKLLGILALPFILLQNRKIKFFKMFSLVYIPASLIFFFYIMMFFLPGEDVFSGAIAFSQNWEWNSGLYSILKNGIGLDPNFSRKTCALVFVIFYIYIWLKFFKKKLDLIPALFLIYSGLMFFSPVYNGWYSIWFLPFAIQLNSLLGVLYACASSLGYVSWGNEDVFWLRAAEFGTHIFFIGILLEAYIKTGFAGHAQENSA